MSSIDAPNSTDSTIGTPGISISGGIATFAVDFRDQYYGLVGAVGLLLVFVLAGPLGLLTAAAIGLGVTVLGERLGPQHAGGLALIALGLALIDGRLVRWGFAARP